MRIATTREPLKSLEFAALTDIVLNMFIFFFISFSLLYTFSAQRMAKIDVKLPEATNVEAPNDLKNLTIIVTDKGEVYLDQKKMSMKELKINLERGVKKNPDVSVMVMSDRLAPFKYIVEILDTLTGLHVTRLSIAATKGED